MFSILSGAEGLGCSLAFVTGCKNIGRILDQDIYRVTDVSFISIRNASIESSGCASEVNPDIDIYR